MLNEPDDELSDNRATELATEPRGAGWPFETPEIADDAIVGDQPCGSSGPRALEPPPVLERIDDSRLEEAQAKQKAKAASESQTQQATKRKFSQNQ